MAKLVFEHVKKVYDGHVCAVKDFNLEVEENEFIVLVGPSGCGKTTTLRMLAGLEEITEGKIIVDGEVINDYAPSKRNIAMVFQNYALFGNKTVYDNIAFSKIINHDKSDDIYETVIATSKIVNLEGYLNRFPNQLSGGQRQRVALGRAIAKNANLLLMDEPLSNLDAKLRASTRKEIIKLHKEFNTTTVYVTHDQIEAMSMASRIVVMNDGDIMQIGTPKQIYQRPVNVFVAQFIGTHPMNIIDCLIKDGKLVIGKEEITLPAELKEKLKLYEGKPILFGFRAETVTLAKQEDSDRLSIEVNRSEYLGSQFIIKGNLHTQEITITVPAEADIEHLYVKIDLSRASFFDKETKESVLK